MRRRATTSGLKFCVRFACHWAGLADARGVGRRLALGCGWLLLAQAGARCEPAAADLAGKFILQSNDFDPTILPAEPDDRWYHWTGADAAITHLETGLAVDAVEFAGRGLFTAETVWQKSLALEHTLAVELPALRARAAGP